MLRPRRRGACPTLAEPMPTGDGLLARIIVRGTVPLDALAALCRAARRNGSGVIEVTARGNVQVRGLTATTKGGFASAVAALDLDLATGAPITLNPLAGLELGETATDSVSMAAELDHALAASPFVAQLGPKVSITIDTGGALHLDALAADVRLTIRHDVHVAVGGDAESALALGGVASADAVEAVMRLLGVIAQRGRTARARDILRTEGPEPFHVAVADLVVDAPAPQPRARAEPLGIHPLREGASALGLALPFGHAHSDLLDALAGEAGRAGANGLRLAPGRVLLFIGLASREAAARLQLAASRLGCIVDPDDSRRHIAACPGTPHCASAALSTRELAPTIAMSAAALLDGSFTLHLSGCAKGCAHRGRTALTLVGIGDEAGLVLEGAAQDVPCAHIGRAELPSTLARLAREVAVIRRENETAACALSRLRTPMLASLAGEALDG